MRIVKLLAFDFARLIVVAAVVFITWIVAWELLRFINWGEATGYTVATVAGCLNGLTCAYNMGLDTDA